MNWPPRRPAIAIRKHASACPPLARTASTLAFAAGVTVMVGTIPPVILFVVNLEHGPRALAHSQPDLPHARLHGGRLAPWNRGRRRLGAPARTREPDGGAAPQARFRRYPPVHRADRGLCQ